MHHNFCWLEICFEECSIILKESANLWYMRLKNHVALPKLYIFIAYRFSCISKSLFVRFKGYKIERLFTYLTNYTHRSVFWITCESWQLRTAPLIKRQKHLTDQSDLLISEHKIEPRIVRKCVPWNPCCHVPGCFRRVTCDVWRVSHVRTHTPAA